MALAHAQLVVDGEISIPRSFNFDDLKRIPEQVSERATLFGRRDFIGVRLSALVESLRPKSWARFVIARGADGYVANIPVEDLAECVLVYAVGELPLWEDLGGPVRLFASGGGRCANVKNVVSLSFAIEPAHVEHACRHEHARVARGRSRTARSPG
jgi:DMSO/TMAO reductase YedYZ molybdopterin-dependent catalytic subunit